MEAVFEDPAVKAGVTAQAEARDWNGCSVCDEYINFANYRTWQKPAVMTAAILVFISLARFI